MVGTFTITIISYFALIDIRSTHSYVSCKMVDKLRIWVEETISNETVVSPSGQSVHVNKIYKRYSLQVQGVVFPGDLMELPFGESDLILGMYWLSEHQVSLDCDMKRVTIRTPEGSKVIMIRERWNFLSNVISALVAYKFILKGVRHI